MHQVKRARFLAFLLVTLLGVSSYVTVFAATGTKTLEASYRDITIYVDGTIVTPVDGKGETTEPFIVDGTAYLPIRAISETLGKRVGWDESTNSIYIGVNPENTAGLYAAAIQDAMIITDDDIFPLVEISEDSELCTFNEKGQVLMLTYHSYPDSYIAGEEYTLIYGAVWTITDQEIIQWYRNNKDGVTDWELRFKQLIGLPEDQTYTHFSAMWVELDDITRPGYAWKLSDTVGATFFAEEPDEEYKMWFDSNIIWSYFDSAYPWTRLGYTYDWAAGSGKYGLSEFLIRRDAVTYVEFTLTTEEFIAWLEAK